MKLNNTHLDDQLNGLMVAAAIAITLVMGLDATRTEADMLIARRATPVAAEPTHQVAQAGPSDSGRNDAGAR